MITRTYPDPLTAWKELVRELSYDTNHLSVGRSHVKALRWGVSLGYPDVTCVNIEDALLDLGLHLGMSSFTKSRWTRFLRRYFRPDLREWIAKSVIKLLKYPNRPFVASYSVNLNPEPRTNEDGSQIGVGGGHGGHNYGGCLSSLQIRIHPIPTVILFSRACQLDKIGFLDMALIHLVAKELRTQLGGKGKVKAKWIISLPFISAISQVYYTRRFKQPMKGHALERRIRNNRDRETSPYGPLKRLLKRNKQLKELGEIPHSCPVSELSLDFTLAEEE